MLFQRGQLTRSLLPTQEGETLQAHPDLPGGYDQVEVCLEDTWVLEPGVEGPGEWRRLGAYGPLDYRTAARTLFLRPYLAHFCPVFSRFFAVFSVLTPGFQKVAPKDRGAVP